MSLAGARRLARWCPAWRRREPGLRLPRGTWEGARRYCRAVLGVRAGPGWREGARSSGMTREALSTDAACAGGPARSSGEPAVMAGERRGRVICGWFVWSTGKVREELHGRAEAAGKAVRYLEVGGAGG